MTSSRRRSPPGQREARRSRCRGAGRRCAHHLPHPEPAAGAAGPQRVRSAGSGHQVDLGITRDTGSGTLPGSLLCGVADQLDGPSLPALSDIAADLVNLILSNLNRPLRLTSSVKLAFPRATSLSNRTKPSVHRPPSWLEAACAWEPEPLPQHPPAGSSSRSCTLWVRPSRREL